VKGNLNICLPSSCISIASAITKKCCAAYGEGRGAERPKIRRLHVAVGETEPYFCSAELAFKQLNFVSVQYRTINSLEKLHVRGSNARIK
jgi:hypothetical protein